MSMSLIRLGDVPALINRERQALAELTDPEKVWDVEKRAAAIADLTKRAGLAVPIQNEATFLRAEALERLAVLVDQARDLGEILKQGDNRYTSGSRTSIGIPKQRIAEGRSLARTGAVVVARQLAETHPDVPISMDAILKQAKRSERDTAIAERRKTQEAQAKAEIQASPHNSYRLELADIRNWRPTGVDAIITDPPYITDDAVELHAALGDFAADVLPDGGALAVMTWQPLLPQVIQALNRPELVYRWTAAWIYETTARTPERKPRVFDGWKPILVYHKNHIPDDVTYLYDVVRSPDADKTHHAWGQSPEGFMQLIRAFTSPGQTVCDPFLGGGTTAVAALAESRRFIGADNDSNAIVITQERLT